MPADVPVLATTATANARVVADVAEQLGRCVGPDHPRTARAQTSLRLGVLRLPDAKTRLGWLLSHLADLPGSGIIYTLTVSAAEDTARLLREAGHEVRAYTGQTDPAEREDLEAALKANAVKALVATSALGMGFDKPDLGFVLHLGAPSSPVAYYQQVGRAGRATASAGRAAAPRARGPRHLAVLRDRVDAVAGPGVARARASSPTGRPCRPPRSRRWSTSAAPSWSCCSRCSTSTARCVASAAAGSPPAGRGPTTPTATSGSRPPAPPSRTT